MGSSVLWEGNIHEEIPMNLIHFADLLMVRESNSQIRKLTKFSELGIREVRESGGVSNREPQ
jgi:hypothetical protein